MARRVIEQFALMARERPDAAAIVTVAPSCSAQRCVTVRELSQEVLAAAGALRAHGSPGDVVMLCAANQPEFISAFLGALAADMTIFPVHPGLTRHEISEAAGRAGARILVTCPSRFESLRDLNFRLLDINRLSSQGQEHGSPPRSPTARGGLMLQTSGTTGTPKIVFRSGESLDAVARNVAESVGLTPNDRVLAAMPLCHSYGVENGLLGPILAGAAIHLSDGFDPASISRHFASEGITVLPGVPFMYQILAERSAPFDAPMLRLAYSAGGWLPETIARIFCARFGIRIGQLYGSTEMGSVTFGDPHQEDFCSSGVGKPMGDVSIRILDSDSPEVSAPLPGGLEGLVAVRTPSMLDHFVGEESPALQDGYFLTGDLGRMDDGGNLIITGRIKLQIDIGGMKVNPLEVEQVLLQHPAVRECVVVPERMTHTVNRLKAIVSLHEQKNEEPEELRRFVRERLASYKVPRLIELRDSLPKSPTGKILREALRCG